MFGENKNLKDSQNNFGMNIKDSSLPISYTKTDKLITALYMVTDIIDKDEPLRNKLRILGTGIISDIYSMPLNVCGKIAEMVSFLDIASAVNIISEMNCNILRKEFLELNQAIKQSTGRVEILDRQINLSHFFKEPENSPEWSKVNPELSNQKQSNHIGHYQSIGHRNPTRIGVQKGSTLMKALSDRNFISSIGGSISLHKNSKEKNADSFVILKKQRSEDIIKIIKILGRSATIKDIKDTAKIKPEQAGSIVSCGEKTLQRELVSMVKDGVLDRMGEKRWSRYFIKD